MEHFKRNFRFFLGVVFYILAGFCVGNGFHKMFVYQSPELLDEGVNAYVGGDAYNYIINAGYSVGYFVLANLFVILGSTMFILHKMYQNKKEE